MRSGVCEQALSPDAAAVMRQAASAARRRGHAQVTPLHVASAMLSSSSASDGGVLRGACLRSRPAASHPLQCKALELCLNVALNRLATTTTAYAPPAVSWPHHHQQQQRQPPALSNALAAAFKRAQASQRRGGAGAAAEGSSNHSRVVEVEQLVVSILDDPSVSRVMRDAGFSSAEVKANVLLLAGDNNDKPAAAAAAISSSSPDHNSSNTTSTGGASPPPNPSATKLLDTTIIQSTKPDAVARRVLDRTAGGGGGRGAPWRGGGQPSMEARVSGEMHPVVLPHGGLALSLAGGDSEITYGSTDMVVTATPANVPSWIRGPVLSVPELTLGFSSSPPPAAAYSSSIYGGFPHYDHNLFDPRQQQLLLMNHRHENSGPIIMAQSSHGHPWPTSPTNPGGGGSSNSVSISSSGGAPPTAETAVRRRRPRFTELTAENLKVLSDAIEARVPGHRALAPAVASAVLRRRSGVATASTRTATTTWLVFQGMDIDSKMAMARELARLVFGSYDDFATVVELTNNKPVRSGGSSSGKRPRSSSPEEEEEELGYVMRRLHEAVRENPHRVFLIEPTDNNGCSEEEADINIIKSAIATGIVRGRDGDDVASLEDAIVVLSFSCEGTEPWWSRVITSPRRRLLKQPRHDIGSKELDDDGVTEKGPRLSLDLNACAVVDGEPEEGRSSSLDGISAEILDAVDGVFFFQC